MFTDKEYLLKITTIPIYKKLPKKGNLPKYFLSQRKLVVEDETFAGQTLFFKCGQTLFLHYNILISNDSDNLHSTVLDPVKNYYLRHIRYADNLA
jgi:hypothetical protein